MTLSRRNSRRERPKLRASLICSGKTTKVGRVPRRKRCKLKPIGQPSRPQYSIQMLFSVATRGLWQVLTREVMLPRLHLRKILLASGLTVNFGGGRSGGQMLLRTQLEVAA